MDRERERMDEERLAEMRQPELGESNVNEEFVDALKKWGPTVLMVVLLCLIGVLGWMRWQQSQQERVDDAWMALASSATPGAFEDIANDPRHSDVFAVPHIARLRAANLIMQFVQQGQNIGRTEGDPDFRMTEEDREGSLADAERLYRAVIDADEQRNQSARMTIHAINAMNGLASVFEARGNADDAARWYERAAERAGDQYPALARQARRRADSVHASTGEVVLLSQEELQARRAANPVEQTSQAGRGQAAAPGDEIVRDAFRSLFLEETD